jgi:hypothetical protein
MGWTSESPARKAQEERWAAKAGPLKVYYRNPATGEERERPPEG